MQAVGQAEQYVCVCGCMCNCSACVSVYTCVYLLQVAPVHPALQSATTCGLMLL